MRTKRNRLTAVVSLLVIDLLLCSVGAAAPPVVTSTFENHIELKTWRNQAGSSTGSQRLSERQIGNENQDATCNNSLIRNSVAEASANAKTADTATSNDGFTVTEIQLDVQASANGGGFRTCDLCMATCIGTHPRDTDALARANATANTSYDAQYLGASLEIVARHISSDASVRIIDNHGNLLIDKVKEGERYLLPFPAEKLVVQSALAVVAANTGTCCSDSRAAHATVQLAARLVEGTPPQLSAAIEPVPRIIGGQLETGYPAVGLLIIDDGVERCTGTLVGRQTVLTAAHCVQGKNPYKSRIKFLVLNDFIQRSPDNTYMVMDATFPSDMTTGFAFDNLILADDIALIYLASQPKDPNDAQHVNLLKPIDLFSLPTGGLESIQAESLLFVGFGFAASPNKVGDLPQGSSVSTKRSVGMQIAKMSRRTFRNEAPGQNTCRGDSGGPALYLGQGAPQVVGVISSGDQRCVDYGINTRVDVYIAWLQGKIR